MDRPLQKLGYGGALPPVQSQKDRNAAYEKKFVDKIAKLENYIDELQDAIIDRDEFIDKLKRVIDYMIIDLTEKCGQDKVNDAFFKAKIAAERVDDESSEQNENDDDERELSKMKKGGGGGGGGGGSGNGKFLNTASPELFGKSLFQGGSSKRKLKSKKK